MKKTISRIFDILLLAMFAYFIIVQFNDNDGFFWIGVYALAGILAIISILGRPTKVSGRLMTAGICIYLILNTHLLTDWLNSGKPDFIDYEPTFIKEAEQMRELLGLVIVLLVSVYYGFMKRKNP